MPSINKFFSFLIFTIALSNTLQSQNIVYNFTTCGSTDMWGPGISNINATYTIGNTLYQKVSIPNWNGFQQWTVPASGIYNFVVKGAQALPANLNTASGKGAIMQADIYLKKGSILNITVGQQSKGGSNNAAGGAGGSFVAIHVTSINNSTPLIIAGGGGGSVGEYGTPTSIGLNGSTNNNGTDDAGGTWGGDGGTNGSGGPGGNYINSYTVGAGGGGGFKGSGYGVNNCYTSSCPEGGGGFTDGGYLRGGYAIGQNVNNIGGFGGGGGQGNSAGGGGGGYSGGKGGNVGYGGGGGGSYLINTANNIASSDGKYNGTSNYNGNAIVNLNSYNTGEGLVVITRYMSAGYISTSQTPSQKQCGGLPFTPLPLLETETPSNGIGSYTYQWQSSTDSLNFTDIVGETNAGYTPPTITAYGAIYYRRKVMDNNNPSPNIAYSNIASIIVDEVPTTPTTTNIAICNLGSTATLTGNPAIVGTGVWNFVTGPAWLTIANTSSPTSTVTGFTSNGTYQVKWTIASDHGICSANSICSIVIGVPTVQATVPNSACANHTVNLSATPSAGTINWYTSATGGSIIFTGNSFTTPVLNATTNYYAEAAGTGCVSSARTLVTAIINANPVLSVTGNTTNIDLVQLTATGGTSYQWSGGNAGTSASNAFDASGLYSVTATAANGCYTTTLLNVTVQHMGLNKFGKMTNDSLAQVDYYGKIAGSNTLSSKGNKIAYKKSGIPVPSALINTLFISNISSNTAIGNGMISTDASFGISARGMVWSTLPHPTIANTKTIDGAGTGIFTSSITGLTSATTYFIRTYATNGFGTNYGNEIQFTTN